MLIESPCTGVCRLDPADEQCTGCWRTLDEIGRWSVMAPAERAAVTRALPGRRGGGRGGIDDRPD